MLKFINCARITRLKLYRSVSTSSACCQGGELIKVQERDDAIRVVQRKPNRPPLAKKFFLGVFDSELIAYPEAIYENEHLQIIQKRKQEYEDFLDANIFANPDDVNNVRKLKEFGSFRNYSALVTDSIYRKSESQGKILSYNVFLNRHQQVMRLIEKHGDETQKLKYIPKLEAGDFVGVPSIFESKLSPCGKKTFITEAKYKDSSDRWILNGEKAFVLLSPADKDSSLFLVVAIGESVDRKGDYEQALFTLLVDGSLPGVTISGVDEVIGLGEKAFNQVTISFDNVSLDKSCLLGKDGVKVGSDLLNMMRLDKGVEAMQSVMKPLIKQLTDHCINTKIQGVHLKDIDTVKEQLGYLATNCYALESMIYMTAGLIDIYEKQDVEVESAIVQAFAIETMTDFMVRPLHSVGPLAVVKGAGFDKYIREATQVAASGEQLDIVRQFIALGGLNHAGQQLAQDVKKHRNPLDHPAFVWSRFFKETSIETPRKSFHFENYVHPTLEPAADFVESSVLRLKAASEILLGRHGALVVQHTVEVAKIGEAAVLCYAMFAAISRASRSYCVGLRNADHEIHLASCFSYIASQKVKHIAKGIDNSEYGTSEHTFKLIGEKLIENKNYQFEHPTAKNY